MVATVSDLTPTLSISAGMTDTTDINAGVSTSVMTIELTRECRASWRSSRSNACATSVSRPNIRPLPKVATV